jgi:hypothetical protein
MSENLKGAMAAATARSCIFVKFCYLRDYRSMQFLNVLAAQVMESKRRESGSNMAGGCGRTALNVQRNTRSWIFREGLCIQ